MDPFETHDPKRIEDIFLDALDVPESERSDFLDRQCGTDSDLRREVEQLLAADEAAGDGEFLKSELLRDAPPVIPSSSDPSSATTEATRFLRGMLLRAIGFGCKGRCD